MRDSNPRRARLYILTPSSDMPRSVCLPARRHSATSFIACGPVLFLSSRYTQSALHAALFLITLRMLSFYHGAGVIDSVFNVGVNKG
jgi:hypothetical protein